MTMKHLTLLAALISTMTMSTAPAWATLGSTDDANMAMASQPAAYYQSALDEARTNCGDPEQVMIMLRDPTGAVVATTTAEIPATC